VGGYGGLWVDACTLGLSQAHSVVFMADSESMIGGINQGTVFMACVGHRPKSMRAAHPGWPGPALVAWNVK